MTSNKGGGKGLHPSPAPKRAKIQKKRLLLETFLCVDMKVNIKKSNFENTVFIQQFMMHISIQKKEFPQL